MVLVPFHLALPVHDLPECLSFYQGVLGYAAGRQAEQWVDLNMHGHQLVLHQVQQAKLQDLPSGSNSVDQDQVPVPHFGLVLAWADWEALAERIRVAGYPFVLEPRIRFRGQVGEQGTFFLRDPSANALEFKAFRNPERLFAS